MSFLTIALGLLLFVYDSSAVDVMPELKRNILNFGYGVNFKYEGMLSHLSLTLNAVMLTILVPILIMQNF